MKLNLSLGSIFSCIFLSFLNLSSMEGGRVDGSMAREGMGFHRYHGGYHGSAGGYGYGRAYGAFHRHFGTYSHRGYDRYGNPGYVRNEADPYENFAAQQSAADRQHLSTIQRKTGFRGGSQAAEMRAARALGNRPRGGKYWGYYNSYYNYGLYPWYNYGDPFYYYQKADYYPWYYGYNPGWLWW